MPSSPKNLTQTEENLSHYPEILVRIGEKPGQDSGNVSPEPICPEFVRLQTAPNGTPLSFDLSVVHFVPTPDSPWPDATLDLIGAVHFADTAYYDELNRLFEEYDVVLYEMILPRKSAVTAQSFSSPAATTRLKFPLAAQHENRFFLNNSDHFSCDCFGNKFFIDDFSDKKTLGNGLPEKGLLEISTGIQNRLACVWLNLATVTSSRAAKRSTDGKSSSPLSLIHKIQVQMSQTLGLVYQLDAIDYTRKNMVHADTDAETLWQEMLDKNGPQSFFYESLASSFQAPTTSYSAVAIALLFSHNRQLALKRIMAIELFESFHALPQGQDVLEYDFLIANRNNIALKHLHEELQSGKQRIAIFYGVAHLPHFTRSLKNEFFFSPISESWLEAWSLKKD